jgi:hypothetical protein
MMEPGTTVEPWWAREQPEIQNVPVRLDGSPRPPLRRESSPSSIMTPQSIMELDAQSVAPGWEMGTSRGAADAADAAPTLLPDALGDLRKGRSSSRPPWNAHAWNQPSFVSTADDTRLASGHTAGPHECLALEHASPFACFAAIGAALELWAKKTLRDTARKELEWRSLGSSVGDSIDSWADKEDALRCADSVAPRRGVEAGCPAVLRTHTARAVR